MNPPRPRGNARRHLAFNRLTVEMVEWPASLACTPLFRKNAKIVSSPNQPGRAYECPARYHALATWETST